MSSNDVLFYDVVIIGAGPGGISSAYHLKKHCPQKTFIILDKFSGIGGTWFQNTYPGVRSDASIWAFSFYWHQYPLNSKYITGGDLLDYFKEACYHNDLTPFFKFNKTVTRLKFDSTTNIWEIYILNEDGKLEQINCRFIMSNMGYINHEKPHIPVFNQQQQFHGEIVHSQKFPKDMDLKNKNVLVIGSGATSISMVPELAKTANVTLLQRSPSWLHTRNNSTILFKILELLFCSKKVANVVMRVYELVTWFLVHHVLSLMWPLNRILMFYMKKRIALKYPNLDMKHFTPKYKLWEQRPCLMIDDDLLKLVDKKHVTIHTDTISHFHKDGVFLVSGKFVATDVVILATGFELFENFFHGNVEIYIDDKKFHICDEINYNGYMITNLPNLTWANGSFILPAIPFLDMIAHRASKLISEMSKHNYDKCYIKPNPNMFTIDGYTFRNFVLQSNSPNYLKRWIDKFPRGIPKFGIYPKWGLLQGSWFYIFEYLHSSFNKDHWVFYSKGEIKIHKKKYNKRVTIFALVFLMIFCLRAKLF